MLPIFKEHNPDGTTKYNKDAVAIINYDEHDDEKKEYSYGELHRASHDFAIQLLELSSTDDLKEQLLLMVIKMTILNST